jgi:hypothetical protein
MAVGMIVPINKIIDYEISDELLFTLATYLRQQNCFIILIFVA